MEIYALGGYNEVGRNMTAIKVGDEIVIIDIGIYLPAVLSMEEEERLEVSVKRLKKAGALPDDSIIAEQSDKVKAIVLGHCHLDHIAGVPFFAPRYKAPVIGTPYTIEVLKEIMKDDEMTIPNELITVNQNSKIKISKNITIELIGVTHSTAQCAFVAVHTPEGTVLYCNDFKFDNSPQLGQPPNYERLKELKNVKALICESLYAERTGKTPSEKVAKEMLKDVMLGVENRDNAIFVTTFASHIARISSIIEFSKKLKREVVLVGRSMAKYVGAANRLRIVNFAKDAAMSGYAKQIKQVLKKVEKNRNKYVVVCTGSQGEPDSILDKIVSKKLDFNFKDGDHVIFSCKTIPEQINIENRAALEAKLKKHKVRIFTDIHVSGHSSSEDLRDLIQMVKPKNVIPAHGDAPKLNNLARIAEECNYKLEKNLFIMHNGRKITV
ncbi:MAG: RNase J family beta-CASP ribonuclease [Candidatus Nanoarchaeia archaeon]|nr:RNase J family beta-CASP ribonuclease [Candidatus Nanoarchaeia archaeon]